MSKIYTYTNLQELTAAALKCTACGLCKNRTQVVPGEGNPRAEVMFIGEGPGQNEDQQGRPFVGAAGQFLNELLATISLKRTDVYIANVVKCRPPGNRDPLPEEIEACHPWLDGQIAFINPRVIVTLGRHSMAVFFPGESITRIHGSVRVVGNRTILPMFHPAAALYRQELRGVLAEDFKKIPTAIERIRQQQARPRISLEPEPDPGAVARRDQPKQLNLF